MKRAILTIITLILTAWPLGAGAQYDFTWYGWYGPPESVADWTGSWASAGDTYTNGWGNTWIYWADPAPYYPGSSSAVLLPTGYDINCGNGTCATLDIEVGAVLNLPYSTLNIHGPTLLNDGEIYMSNYTSTLGLIRLLGDLELTGEGGIYMDGGRFADVGVTRALTIGADQTVEGWGEFGHDSYWGQVNIHNLSTVAATSSQAGQFLALHSVESHNDGVLEAVGTDLYIYGIWDNHDGVIRAGDGMLVRLEEALPRSTEIIGGTMESEGSGEIRPGSGALLEDVTVDGVLYLLRYRSMDLRTGLTINGIFRVGDNNSAGLAGVNLVSDLHLDGSGVVEIGEANQIRCIEWPAENYDLTVGSDLTVNLSGGSLGWYPDYYGDRRLELYNEGTIVCRGVVYNPNFYLAGEGFTNTGSLLVDPDTQPARIYGPFRQTGGETRVAGELRFEESPATFTGGALGGSGWLAGSVTISTSAQLDPGEEDLPGTLSLGGHLGLDDGATYLWDYTGTTQDLIYLSGDLDLTGNIHLTVRDPQGAGLAAGDYILIQVDGDITDSATWDITLPIGWLSSGVEVVGQQVILRELRLDAIAVDEGEPQSPFKLLGAVPNPFNPSTEIGFNLDGRGSVNLNVFDTAGRLIRTLIAAEAMSGGRHSVRWDGLDDAGVPVASGTYLYRLTMEGRSLSDKMTLLK